MQNVVGHNFFYDEKLIGSKLFSIPSLIGQQLFLIMILSKKKNNYNKKIKEQLEKAEYTSVYVPEISITYVCHLILIISYNSDEP